MRALRSSALRDALRDSKAHEKAARLARGDALWLKRAECKAARERIQSECAIAREAIRDSTHGTIDREKARRAELRDYHRATTGKTRVELARKRMSKRESDSLAVHNIPPHLVDLFLELRGAVPGMGRSARG